MSFGLRPSLFVIWLFEPSFVASQRHSLSFAVRHLALRAVIRASHVIWLFEPSFVASQRHSLSLIAQQLNDHRMTTE
jgi:hypothetical protein